MEVYMDNYVRDLLKKISRNPKKLKKDLNTFSKVVKENTTLVYHLVFRDIVEDYKNDPDRECGVYQASIKFITDYDETVDNKNNIFYSSTLSDLAKEYSKKNNDKVLFLIWCIPKLNGLYFNESDLSRKLLKDGFSINVDKDKLSFYMDVNQFRKLINNNSKTR